MSSPFETVPPITPPREAIQPTIILPPEEAKEPSHLPFVLFTVAALGAATVAGLMQSGRLSLDMMLGRKPAHVTAAAAAKPTPPPPVPLKAGAFAVTSISVGRQSYAIINGVSHTQGDRLDAPDAKGWWVRRIDPTVVWLQNQLTVTSVPLTDTGLKPLDDTLHTTTGGLKQLNDTLHPLN